MANAPAPLLNVIDPPPRMTGKPEIDGIAALQWEWSLFVKGILNGGLVQQQNLPGVLAANLQAFATLVGAADQLAYFTGPNAISLTTLTAFARTILDDLDAAAVKLTLGIVGGTPSATVVTETAFGQASNVGASDDFSRGDHTHGTPAAPTATSVGADPAGTAAASPGTSAPTYAANAITATDLTTTGNTILGDTTTDTLNVGAGGIIKDAAGNVGIGATPQAWGAGYTALDFPSGTLWSNSVGNFFITQNLYYDGANFRYKANGGASRFDQGGITSTWYTAPVGVAGNVATLTSRMSINETKHIVSIPFSVTDTTDAISSITGAIVTSGGGSVAKAFVAGTTIRTGGFTVATLPAGVVGDRAYVTDALAPAYSAAVVAGGAIRIPVYRNATVWICA